MPLIKKKKHLGRTQQCQTTSLTGFWTINHQDDCPPPPLISPCWTRIFNFKNKFFCLISESLFGKSTSTWTQVLDVYFHLKNNKDEI